MKQITIDEMRATAAPGDILIGTFPNPLMHCINPIILIGECVGCVVDKDDVIMGVAFYLKQEDDKYIKYEVVR